MTSIFEWLPQLWAVNGPMAKRIHRFLIAAFAVYVLLIVVSVFLSAFGLRQANWAIMTIYVFGVISLGLSPVLWEGLVAAGYVRGQVGGEEGFSIADGVARVKDWAVALLKHGGKVILFYGSLPFAWTAIHDTAGAIGSHLVLLPLLPLVIYYSLKRWPTSESVFLKIGMLFIMLVFWNIGLDVYNSVQRRFADPSSQVVYDYEQKQRRKQLENDEAAAKKLLAKRDRGEDLTPQETMTLERIQAKAHNQSFKDTTSEATNSLRVYWNNEVFGPLMQWGKQHILASEVRRRERAIVEQVTETYTVDVTICLEGVYKRAAADNSPKRVTKEEVEACKALDTNPWKKKDGEPERKATSNSATTKSLSSGAVIWRGDFSPGRDSMSIGNFPESGSYRIRGSGEYTLRVIYADRTYTDAKLDKDGHWVGSGGGTQLPYSGPQSHPAPFPDKAVGAVYAIVNGQKQEASLNGGCFLAQAGEEGRVDPNTPTHPENRVTTGKLHIWVEKC